MSKEERVIKRSCLSFILDQDSEEGSESHTDDTSNISLMFSCELVKSREHRTVAAGAIDNLENEWRIGDLQRAP